MARLRSERSFNEPETWFLSYFLAGVVGLAYVLVADAIDWLHRHSSSGTRTANATASRRATSSPTLERLVDPRDVLEHPRRLEREARLGGDLVGSLLRDAEERGALGEADCWRPAHPLLPPMPQRQQSASRSMPTSIARSVRSSSQSIRSSAKVRVLGFAQ